MPPSLTLQWAKNEPNVCKANLILAVGVELVNDTHSDTA